MAYRLRNATPDDEPWQLAIYASTRADELAMTGWPAAQCEAFVMQQHQAQQRHYQRYFPASVCQLILVGDAVAGRLWVDARPDRLHVLDITLLPAFRGQGLGTMCLQALWQQAQAGGQALGIQVEIHNPARRLYERLGFIVDGPVQGLYQSMRRPAVHRRPQPEECLL